MWCVQTDGKEHTAVTAHSTNKKKAELPPKNESEGNACCVQWVLWVGRWCSEGVLTKIKSARANPPPPHSHTHHTLAQSHTHVRYLEN